MRFLVSALTLHVIPFSLLAKDFTAKTKMKKNLMFAVLFPILIFTLAGCCLFTSNVKLQKDKFEIDQKNYSLLEGIYKQINGYATTPAVPDSEKKNFITNAKKGAEVLENKLKLMLAGKSGEGTDYFQRLKCTNSDNCSGGKIFNDLENIREKLKILPENRSEEPATYIAEFKQMAGSLKSILDLFVVKQ